MSMGDKKEELRMSVDEFDRLMRKALQTPPVTKKPKAVETKKKASPKRSK